MIKFNIYSENTYNNWNIDLNKINDIAEQLFSYYLTTPDITNNFCLKKYSYESIAFDFLFCDSKQTHEINREYRNKDYPADIITFAVFADSPSDERFILDNEINLGEIIIALDKIIEEAEMKKISKADELYFLISHGILHLLGFDHQTEEDYNFIIKHQKDALLNIGITYDKV